MIAHNVEQGSAAWHRLRLGCLTASRCRTLVTATGKVSKGAGVQTLVNELVAERLIGEPVTDASGPWMERGTTLEAEARAWYAFEKGVDVAEVGFITRDDGRVGCSPDGLVGEDGGLELKVPSAKVMVGYALDHATLAAAYRHQVQMSLMVTGRSWWDLAAYSPSRRIPSVAIRVEPDADYLSALRDAIAGVLTRVDDALSTIGALCPVDHLNPFE